MTERVALITEGMGGLGETISTKMASAGYKVAVTYSPSNKNSTAWLAEMASRVIVFTTPAKNASRALSTRSAPSTFW